MAPPALPSPAPPLSPWLIAAGSLLIVYHLAAIIVPTLGAPSGPFSGLDSGFSNSGTGISGVFNLFHP